MEKMEKDDFEVFVRAHDKKVRGFARCFVSREDAEDVASEVWIRVFRCFESVHVRQMTSIDAWLYIVTKNVATDYRRAHARSCQAKSIPFEDGSHQGESGPFVGPEHALDRARLCRAFDRAIGCLNNNDQELLGLLIQDGLSYEQIAQKMKVPIGTIKTRIHAARDRLARFLKELNGCAHEEKAEKRRSAGVLSQ